MCSNQDYFWQPEWQEGEKEADADIKAGRVMHFSNVNELIKSLKSNSEVVLKNSTDTKRDY